MPGIPKAFPKSTFAVFLPTPGRVTRSSRVFGTSPPNRFTSFLTTFLERFRFIGESGRPISSSSVARFESAKSFCRAILLKEIRRHLVHLNIRALGGENSWRSGVEEDWRISERWGRRVFPWREFLIIFFTLFLKSSCFFITPPVQRWTLNHEPEPGTLNDLPWT